MDKIQLDDRMAADVQKLLAAGVGGSLTRTSEAAIQLHQSRNNPRVQAWKAWRSTLADILASNDPAIKARVEQARSAMRQKFLTAGSVHSDSTIADMSVMYTNEAYIGMELLPPVLVDHRSNEFAVYDPRDNMALPDDNVTDYGGPNMLVTTRATSTYLCKGYGFSNGVAATVVANQDAAYDELLAITEQIIEVESLKQEVRAATVLTTAGNYSGNTVALGAADRWDSAGGGQPIKNIQDADAEVWSGFGPTEKVMFSSLPVYNVLSRHPDILALFQYNGSSPGLATPDMIAQFFGASRFLIGRARYDAAKEGQASGSFQRVWSNVFGIVQVAKSPSLRMAPFGLTFRWKMNGIPGVQANSGWVTQQWFEAQQGIGGVYMAKATLAEDHKVVAPRAGYLITTPIG